MSKSTLIGVCLVIIAVVGVAGFILSNQDEKTVSNNLEASQNQELSQTKSDGNAESSTYTAEEVAKHKTSTDCWTIISGKVYDLTPYIDRHDGGDEILRACGIDGTSLFTQRKTSSGEDVGTGTPHSENAQNDLSKLIIGTVATQ